MIKMNLNTKKTFYNGNTNLNKKTKQNILATFFLLLYLSGSLNFFFFWKKSASNIVLAFNWYVFTFVGQIMSRHVFNYIHKIITFDAISAGSRELLFNSVVRIHFDLIIQIHFLFLSHSLCFIFSTSFRLSESKIE